MADLVVELRNRWVDREMEGGRRYWRRLGSLACGEGDRLLLLVAGLWALLKTGWRRRI
jgi:hypothetical protein